MFHAPSVVRTCSIVPQQDVRYHINKKTYNMYPLYSPDAETKNVRTNVWHRFLLFKISLTKTLPNWCHLGIIGEIKIFKMALQMAAKGIKSSMSS